MVYGVRGYRGCEGVIVCGSREKEDSSERQREGSGVRGGQLWHVDDGDM